VCCFANSHFVLHLSLGTLVPCCAFIHEVLNLRKMLYKLLHLQNLLNELIFAIFLLFKGFKTPCDLDETVCV
jgi:hypothetical protein